MSIRRRGVAWQVRLPREPARSFPTRAAAEKYQLNRKLARSLGELHAEPPITVAEMVDGQLERWQAREQPRQSTVRRALQHRDALVRALGDRRLCDLRYLEVEDAFTVRAGKYPNAAKKELQMWNRGLREARKRGQRFDPQLLSVPPIRDVSRPGRALDIDELDQLASWFPEQLARWVLVGGTTGWRPGEGLDLTDDRFDRERGELFIPAAMNKEGRDKVIKLTGSENGLLREQLSLREPGTALLFPGPWGRRWLESSFRMLVWNPATRAAAREWRRERGVAQHAACPFEGMVPHDLRHTGISLMARAGLRPEQIAARVGHKDGGALILRRYRHLFPDELEERLRDFQGFLDRRLEAKREAKGS